MDNSRGKKIAVWVLSVVVAALFAAASIGKLTGNAMVIEQFAGWGYSSSFMYVIGAIEVLGAIALLIPATALYAAGLLGVVMLGATYTHVTNDPILEILRPLIFLGALFVIARLRYKKT